MTQQHKDNLYIVLALGMMALLYWSSSMTYGDQSTLPLLERLLSGQPFYGFLSQFEFTYGGSLVSVASSGYYGFIEFFMRKAAHFFSYFLIGLWWFLGLRRKVKGRPLVALVSLLIVVGYASFDELHQVFTPDRSGMIEDVVLDSFGGLTGIILAWINTTRFWR